MLQSGLFTNRISEIEVKQPQVAPAGSLMPVRSLLREERYDPISGVTITVWSNAGCPAITAEQRPN